MLRMIIADDERIIRETIQSFIDWPALGIEIVGLCKNGLEAYDMILDENPDIVLTDIRMPGLSGLDLIRQIRQISQDVQFIILSGYDDFSYAKKAMEFGIQFYLLKPCSEEEIIEAIETVKKKCFQRTLRKEERQDNLLILKQLHESVISHLLHERLLARSDFESLQAKYENMLDFKNVGYEVCQFQGVNKAVQPAILAGFLNYHNQAAPYVPAYCVKIGEEIFVGFESYDYNYTALDMQMQIVCGANVGYNRLSQSNLTEMLLFLHQQMRGRTDIQIGFEAKPLAEPAQDEILLQQPVDTCVAEIQKIVRAHIHDPELSLKMISESYLYMNVDYLSRKFLKTTGQKFSCFLANERICTAKNLFQAGKCCSVNAVAEQVGCGNNPQYFSQLFKKHTGMTPSEYVKEQTACL